MNCSDVGIDRAQGLVYSMSRFKGFTMRLKTPKLRAI
ncbi:MAG: hypothetical protein ACI9XZ_002889 [Alphaproteobacteria bacterium]|jgi:hypothetical protein